MCAETPNSLVEQGRLEEARKVLEKVRGTKNVDAEFEDLKEASEEARAVKSPFKTLLKRKYRPQLIIGALGIPAFQQLTGNNSILFYAPVIFQSLGFGANAALFSSFITNGALLVATVISMFMVDKFGRRKFFLEAGFEMICCMVTTCSSSSCYSALILSNKCNSFNGIAHCTFWLLCRLLPLWFWLWSLDMAKYLGKESVPFWLLWFSCSYWHMEDLGVPLDGWFRVSYSH